MPEYPGAGRDLRVNNDDSNKPAYPMGIHHVCPGSESDMLLVREVAMMLFMEHITDKPNWQTKVFDEKIMENYTKEALNWPVDDLHKQIWFDQEDVPEKLTTIFNRKTVEYCLHELQAKAAYFKDTGIIPTLDATYAIAKSDVLVDKDLHEELRTAFDRLRADQADNPDFHPNTSEIVQNIIHPSMYPLVYGRSRFIADEVVRVDDAIDKFAGKGEVLAKEPSAPITHCRGSGQGIPKYLWSSNYQWLPSNLRFKEDGSVEFMSYINNLHPIKYRNIYRTIEKLIEKALPMWNQCLPQVVGEERIGAGRLRQRFQIPKNWNIENPDDENLDNWKLPERELDDDYPELNDYLTPEGQRLEELFKDTGLQVIVKMATIELGPSKPAFPDGSWHVEGQMNEHIVATALYYLDSENVTPSHLTFRMLTNPDQHAAMPFRPHPHSWPDGSSCVQNYGSVQTKPGRLLAFPNVFQHRVSSFELEDSSKTGRRSFIAIWLVDPLTRIISTANIPPQREDWFSEQAFNNLIRNNDTENKPTMPREVAQLILDRDVGKGRLDNAMESLPNSRLPAELVEMIRKEMGDSFPMSEEEAKEHRLKLMEERSSFQKTASRMWRQTTYNFCEH